MMKFWAPAPEQFGPLKTKTIVILGKLAFPTNYVCGTGTQILGSGSTIKTFLFPAPAIQNCLGSGSDLTALAAIA